MLHVFYAVTMTSLYRVVDFDEAEGGKPTATKIARKIDGTTGIGQKIKGGSMLSVGRQLITYIPKGTSKNQRGFELADFNLSCWGGRSSPVVALFHNEAAARECLEGTDSAPSDPRWKKETLEVIADIGGDHAIFVICHQADMALTFPDP